jgi:hypothetical protein
LNFLSKNPTKAVVELRDILYDRLKDREIYAQQDPLKDQYFKGLQKGAKSEIEFLRTILDLIERS